MVYKVIIISTAILTFLILLAACRTKFSHCWAHGDSEKRINWLAKKITSELDLNDDQQITLNRIKEEIMAKQREFRSANKREEHLNRFLDEIKKDSLDREVLIKITDERLNHINEMRTFLIDKLIEFHAVLTPEQKEKLAEKIIKLYEKYHKE